MGPMEVCQHITNNFAVSAATYTDDENGYLFHIQVDGAIQFSSFYAYGKEDLQGAIDDVTSVLIKMGLGFKVADGLIAKEKEGPTLDEEFPVQPNGFRFL